MKTKKTLVLTSLFLLLPPLAALAGDYDPRELFKPLPDKVNNYFNPLNPAKLELGRYLFFDPRLSKDKDISCNTCHRLDRWGVDHLPTSRGHDGQRGKRNAPTVFNAALHRYQFWDGRAPSVEEQAKGPILNPAEMASTEGLIVERVRSVPKYVELFKKAFSGGEVTFDNVARAIAAFERTLTTPSRFDRYLHGDDTALTAEELAGMELFIEKGCIGCHDGPAVGGNRLRKFPSNGDDLGRYEATGNEWEKNFFKVPSLRNSAKTPPYFHDGSVESIGGAVTICFEKKPTGGEILTEAEKAGIITFLEALTGEPPEVDPPELPPSE